MGAIDPRKRYLDTGLATASPAKLLTMLYDRLHLDLVTGRQAIVDDDLAAKNERLCHAQDIVLELRTSLDLTVWPDGAGLASLYDYLHRRLIHANAAKDLGAVDECIGIVQPLRKAWHEAAGVAAKARVPVSVGA